MPVKHDSIPKYLYINQRQKLQTGFRKHYLINPIYGLLLMPI